MARYKFQRDDPLRLDPQLSEDERMVRDTAQRYAQDRLMPRVRATGGDAYSARTIFREMGALGLLGPTLPAEYGGAGLNHVGYGLIARELERVDAGFRAMMSAQSAHVMLPIFAFGSEAQKRNYLPKLASGERIGCSGTAAGARSVAGGYRLTGNRICTAHAAIADLCVVWARDEAGGMRGFLLEKGMDEVFVLEENTFPGMSDSQGPALGLDAARYGSAWGTLGATEACWHMARKHTLERNQFGRSLAANQLIQERLADMQSEIALGLQGCLRLGRLKDEGGGAPETTLRLKRNNCGRALAIARAARDMLGGSGMAEAFGIRRHLAHLEAANSGNVPVAGVVDQADCLDDRVDGLRAGETLTPGQGDAAGRRGFLEGNRGHHAVLVDAAERAGRQHRDAVA